VFSLPKKEEQAVLPPASAFLMAMPHFSPFSEADSWDGLGLCFFFVRDPVNGLATAQALAIGRIPSSFQTPLWARPLLFPPSFLRI